MNETCFMRRMSFVLAFLAASALVACGGGDGGGEDVVENTSELCQDGLDNDGNGLIDCDDPGCKDFAFCAPVVEGKENTLSACQDGIDNDGNGLIDCDDPGCKGFLICAPAVDGKENTLSACQDGIDNDGDGLIDCDDPDCAKFEFCKKTDDTTPTSEDTEAACQDGIDNDGNGKIDCADRSCQGFAFCFAGGSVGENTVEKCQDGIDNDGDGLIDCDDPECQEFKFCKGLYAVGEICDNGKDDDGDGFVDCADAECIGKGTCKDECPSDPYKSNQNDGCPCGESYSKWLDKCAENIDQSNYSGKLLNTTKLIEGNYILKSHIALGTVDEYVGAKLNQAGIDGNNKRITGFLTCKSDLEACGLFESIDKSTIANMWLAITIKGIGKVGSLAAVSESSNYHNLNISSKAYAKATKTVNAQAGGLLATSKLDKIANITLDGAASAESAEERRYAFAGALIASATDVQIASVKGIATATSQVTDNQYMRTDEPLVAAISGGVVAVMKGSSSIKDVVSASTVQASFYGSYIFYGQTLAGGIVGDCTNCKLERLSCRGSVRAQADYTSNKSNSVFVQAGGIVGQSEASEINSVSMKGEVTTTKRKVEDASEDAYLNMGGIAGRAIDNKIANASFEGTLNIHSSMTNAGGIVGHLELGSIANSASRGSVVFLPTAVGDNNIRNIRVGGVVGNNHGTLVNTYAKLKDSELPEGLAYYERAALVGVTGSKSFIYESYWSKEDASVISTTSSIGYIDATCENFLLNGKKPEINAKNLFAALRYNIGMANGVASVNLPKPDKYLDWKEVADEDGALWPALDFENLKYIVFE